MSSVYAVYTQFDPTHKYEQQLDTLWLTLKAATEHALTLKHDDNVFIRQINVGPDLHKESDAFVRIYPEKKAGGK